MTQSDLLFAASILSAISTALYLFVTWRLANTTAKNLEYSRTSFDLANQPYINLTSVSPGAVVPGERFSIRQFILVVSNYGRIPAAVFMTKSQFVIIDFASGTEISNPEGENRQTVVLSPGATQKTILSLSDEVWNRVLGGSLGCRLMMEISYRDHNLESKTVRWQLEYHHAIGQFIPI
jgi:hypothetical protein